MAKLSFMMRGLARLLRLNYIITLIVLAWHLGASSHKQIARISACLPYVMILILLVQRLHIWKIGWLCQVDTAHLLMFLLHTSTLIIQGVRRHRVVRYYAWRGQWGPRFECGHLRSLNCILIQRSKRILRFLGHHVLLDWTYLLHRVFLILHIRRLRNHLHLMLAALFHISLRRSCIEVQWIFSSLHCWGWWSYLRVVRLVLNGFDNSSPHHSIWLPTRLDSHRRITTLLLLLRRTHRIHSFVSPRIDHTILTGNSDIATWWLQLSRCRGIMRGQVKHLLVRLRGQLLTFDRQVLIVHTYRWWRSLTNIVLLLVEIVVISSNCGLMGNLLRVWRGWGSWV